MLITKRDKHNVFNVVTQAKRRLYVVEWRPRNLFYNVMDPTRPSPDIHRYTRMTKGRLVYSKQP